MQTGSLLQRQQELTHSMQRPMWVNTNAEPRMYNHPGPSTPSLRESGPRDWQTIGALR